MLLYDIKNGIFGRKRWLFLPILFWFIALCNVDVYIGSNDYMNFGSCLFIILAGNEPVDIYQRTFTLPVLWSFMQLGYMFFTIEYPTRDMNIFGQQIMVRSDSRIRWILSKCLWVIMNVFIYWAVGFLMICVFCVIKGIPVTLDLNGEIPPSILFSSCDIYVSHYTAETMLIIMLIAPVLSSVAICLIQMLIAVMTNEILALSASVTILVWSMCIRTPLAIGNYAMMDRCSVFNSKGLSFDKGIILLVFIIIAAVTASLLLFKNKDILEAKNNGE